MLRGAGFRALRMTTLWAPGLTRPTAIEGRVLANAVQAARENGIRVYLSVFTARPRDAPTTSARSSEFAAFTAALLRGLPSVRDVIVGNEPNINNFWLPQFDPDGASASPRDYNALLAATYDAVKGVSPEIRVLGGALASRGGDNPNAPRHTHSPTRFLREWGLAYRASGRAAPVMDALAFHPYLESSRLAARVRAPAHDDDRARRLRQAGRCSWRGVRRNRTAGRPLPIAYTEFGVQSRVPEAFATCTRTTTTRLRATRSTRATQAAYYARAIELAACQPTVDALLLFLAFDEPDVARWQSGVFYVDGSWKPSRAAVRGAAERVATGQVTCAG